jgi:hypothetical protein
MAGEHGSPLRIVAATFSAIPAPVINIGFMPSEQKPLTRRIVSSSILLSDPIACSCFGELDRLIGQNLSPMPPARIIGITFMAIFP